ncbi:MAG TPA: hypothetical protein ENK66_07695, partial [Arcobacter sp.]|nr:hypothetical protein [Arcobacter sp.]
MIDAIKKYAVKVEYTLQGSGVLVKIDENHCYLITAKHNFKNNGEEDHNNVDTTTLNFHKIKISNPNNENICQIRKLVYEEKKLDLLIFEVQNDSDYIKNLPFLQIVKDRHTLSKKHFFYGYPNGAEVPSGELTPLAFKVKEEEKHILTLRGDKSLYVEEEQGFSGSGVFIKEGNNEDGYTYYLTGIVTEVHEGQSFFETISLSEIIDKINLNLNHKIKVVEDIVDIGFSQNIYTRILNRNKDIDLVKRILSELEEEKDLEFLKKNDSKRKEIIKLLDMDENQLLKLEKELADLYLLKAIIYHSDDNSKKTTYFNKAKKFNYRYKNYQLDDLDELDELGENNINEIENNEEFNHLQKAKLYFIEHKYNKVIELLKDYIDISNDVEKVERYEYLARSYQKIEIPDIGKSIGYWSKLLGLLNENNILEKAEIYYELSQLYQTISDRKVALNHTLEGLNLLSNDKENNFLEIKYKLEKQKKKLSDSTEENIPNMTLTNLFKKYPEKYMD